MNPQIAENSRIKENFKRRSIAIIATALMGFLLLGWCGDWENEIIEFLKNVFLSSLSIFSFIIILLFIFSVICKVNANIN